MTPTHTFAKGDTVTIFNCTVSGKFFIEGKAVVIRPLETYERYMVRFQHPSLTHGAQERVVDPAGQEDPEGFVERLNGQRGETR
jgi:hypothetical protein